MLVSIPCFQSRRLQRAERLSASLWYLWVSAVGWLAALWTVTKIFLFSKFRRISIIPKPKCISRNPEQF